MASKIDDRLTKEFAKASGPRSKADVSSVPAAGPGSFASQQSPSPKSTASKSTAQSTAKAFSGAADTVGASAGYRGTSASRSSSQSTSSSGGVLGAFEDVGKDMLSGLGIIPLVGSLFGLFGGGSAAQSAFQKYQKPASLNFGGSIVGNSLGNSDYNQLGMPRLYDTSPSTAAPTGAASAASSSPGASTTSGSSASGQQINVNVQAMDSKSFMDYSGQIAQAVRDAMLNLSSINDVVTEL